MKKNIIILGSGKEINHLLVNLSEKHNIVAYGADKSNINAALDSITFCKTKKIDLIDDHKKISLFNPDYVLMINYPKLIEKSFLEKYKFVNMHYALLPKYRGFHGITWAIINGEKELGYTIHLVDEGIDSGPIYTQEKMLFKVNDDVVFIRKKLLEIFLEKGCKTYIDILENRISAIPQIENEAIYVCKRYEADGIINWNDNAAEVHNLIRALKPPYTKGAFTFYKDKQIHIVDSELLNRPSYKSINGQVVYIENNKGVYVKCNDTFLLIKNVIYEGEIINSANLFQRVGIRLKNSL